MKLTATLFLGLLLTISANAQGRWLNDYEGTVGSAKIGLTLVSAETGGFDHGGDIECSYFYVSQLKDIKLKCSVDLDGNFKFNELDEKGNIRAVFSGKFLKNETALAEGTWTRVGQTKSLPFRMRYEQGVSSEGGNRYAQIDAMDPVWFEKQVRDFKAAVLKADKQKVAAHIEYPVSVTVGGKKMRVKNSAAFLTYYDRVFDAAFVAVIGKTVPHNMFAKATGAMLDGGIIWFNGDGKVIAINN